MSQPGRVSVSKASAHECFTHPPPTLAFTLEQEWLTVPRTLGRRAAIYHPVLAALTKANGCPTSWETDVTCGFHVILLLQDLSHGEPVFHPDILVHSTPCDGFSQNLQLNRAPDLNLNLSSQSPYIHHHWGLMIHRGAAFLLITRVVPLEAKIRCETWMRL